MTMFTALLFALAGISGAPQDGKSGTNLNACNLVTSSDIEQNFHAQFEPAQSSISSANNMSHSLCNYKVARPDAGAITSITFEVDFAANNQGLTQGGFLTVLKVSEIPFVTIPDLGVPAYWIASDEKAHRPAQLHAIEKDGQVHLSIFVNGGDNGKAEFAGATAVMRAAIDKISRAQP